MVVLFEIIVLLLIIIVRAFRGWLCRQVYLTKKREYFIIFCCCVSGLVSAAVAGEVFASPKVDSILAAILAVTGDKG